MKHYFLVAKEVGDLTRIFCAALEEHHGKPVPALNRFLRLGRKRRTQGPGHDRFRRRERPHHGGRRQGLRPRPGQPHPRLPSRRRQRPAVPSRGDAAHHPLARADRRQAPRRPRGQPAVSRDPVVAEERRAGAPRHERDRRARPLHPRLRQGRGDDAVLDVPPLHGRRAPDPLDRQPRRDRARRSGGRAPAGERDIPRHQGPGRPLCRALPARYRQGPAGGSLRSPAPGSPGSSGRASASARRRPRPWRGWSSIIS